MGKEQVYCIVFYKLWVTPQKLIFVYVNRLPLGFIF